MLRGWELKGQERDSESGEASCPQECGCRCPGCSTRCRTETQNTHRNTEQRKMPFLHPAAELTESHRHPLLHWWLFPTMEPWNLEKKGKSICFCFLKGWLHRLSLGHSQIEGH